MNEVKLGLLIDHVKHDKENRMTEILVGSFSLFQEYQSQ